MTDLLPCPFCSGKPELIEADTGTKDVWLVRCTWCQVKTVNYYDQVTPRLVWNRREGNYAHHSRSPQDKETAHD